MSHLNCDASQSFVHYATAPLRHNTARSLIRCLVKSLAFKNVTYSRASLGTTICQASNVTDTWPGHKPTTHAVSAEARDQTRLVE